MNLTQDYWNKRYLEDNTPWDIGYEAPALINYIDQIKDKSCRILIPGAGFAHEAVYLHENDFTEVYVCDWAPEAIASFQNKVPDFPSDHLIVEDFFKVEKQFDLIIEQTFFCALSPSLREAYVKKTADLLQNEGILSGLLFAEPFPFEGPPFGGTPEEYRQLFLPYYDFLQFGLTNQSIAPRAGRELFIELKKKPS